MVNQGCELWRQRFRQRRSGGVRAWGVCTLGFVLSRPVHCWLGDFSRASSFATVRRKHSTANDAFRASLGNRKIVFGPSLPVAFLDKQPGVLLLATTAATHMA